MAFKKAGKFERTPARRSSSRDERPSFGDRGGSARSFERKPFGGARDRGALELFNVKCARCGVDTQVPFRPTGEKPVYCRDCFTRGGDDAAPPKRFSAAPAGDMREIHEKLDKIMRALNIK
jgi:CxxC-x17-CxxC domain-containing protein